MIYKIERYGDKFKLVVFKTVPSYTRTLDIEKFLSNDEKQMDRNAKEKALCNLSRSKSRVLELALCNPWQYFVTLTISADKQDRNAIAEYIKALGIWISNYNRKYNCKLAYILIPEQHKDGAWHLHGLFNGVAPESLIINEHGYLDMPYYKNRFGFISLDKIKNKQKCSTYISKYITKQYEQTILSGIEVGKHMFYCSKKLNGKETVEVGDVNEKVLASDKNTMFFNDYVGIKWADSIEDLEMFVNDLNGDIPIT